MFPWTRCLAIGGVLSLLTVGSMARGQAPANPAPSSIPTSAVVRSATVTNAVAPAQTRAIPRRVAPVTLRRARTEYPPRNGYFPARRPVMNHKPWLWRG